VSQAADAPANIAGRLIDTLIASNRGDHHAFAYGEKRYSYQDVAALMNRAGNMVKAMGVTNASPVLVVLPPSPAFVATVLGAIKAGAMPVLGVAAGDPSALQACIAAVRPALVVLHQNDIARLEAALAALPAEAVIVVGGDGNDRKSFVEEMRGQSSWLAAEPAAGDAPALGLWNGASLRTLSHAGLATLIDAGGDAQGNAGVAISADASAAIALLRVFAKGEATTLS
jgi:acyl-coenzyme A synthetase/AMP-(fatty) acid ligase